MTAQEARRLEDQKRAEMQQIFKNAETSEIDPLTGGPMVNMTPEMVLEIRDRESELKKLTADAVALEMQEIAKNNADAMKGIRTPVNRIAQSVPDGDNRFKYNDRVERMDLAAMMVASMGYKSRKASRGHFHIELNDVDFKTLMTTTTGYAPPNPRTNTVSFFPQRQPVIADLIPSDPTDRDIVKFMRETTETFAAASVSEGAAKPESTFVFTEYSAPVVKIAHFIPVTEEQIDDVPGLDNIINNRMTLGLMLKQEDRILNGPGGGDITGFYNAGIGTQSKGADDLQDSIFKAIQQVRFTGFARPTAVLIHPTDWTPIRLLRTTGGTAGLYIWGAPSEVGPDTLWGLPTVVTPAVTVTHPLVGDFVQHSHISMKMGIRIDVSDSHSDWFVLNKLAIRAELRMALEIYRPSAFVQVVA